MTSIKAKARYTAICFYPSISERVPEKFRFRKVEKFFPFALRKGFIYFNVYNRRTKEYLHRVWINENFPRNKKGIA